MYTVFWTVGVVPPWASLDYYSPLIPLIPLPTRIWALQSWMSDTLFPTLVAVFVPRFLAIQFGLVAVKRNVPIVINCLIDSALILPLVLTVVELTLQIFLTALLISLKRLLQRS